MNEEAQEIVEDVVSDADSVWMTRTVREDGRALEAWEITAPDGRRIHLRKREGRLTFHSFRE